MGNAENSVFLQRALCGPCAGPVWALCGPCAGPVLATQEHSALRISSAVHALRSCLSFGSLSVWWLAQQAEVQDRLSVLATTKSTSCLLSSCKSSSLVHELQESPDAGSLRFEK